MRKKIILINSLIVFIALLAMLLICVIILRNFNTNNYKNQAKNYLDLACVLYDGSNEEETIEKIQLINKGIRITFISVDGMVIKDSSNLQLNDSHLNRDEIKYLGEVFIRYSDTLKHDILYIARLDNNVYVRISIPVQTINQTINTFLYLGIATLICLTTLSVLLIFYFSKKSLYPVNNNVKELALLAGKDDMYNNISIDDLPNILKLLSQGINEKIDQISAQKQRTYDVLNSINNGIVVIDNLNIIRLINQKALDIFHCSFNVNDKDFIYLIRHNELQEVIKKCIANQNYDEYSFMYDNKYYHATLKYITASWLKSGLIIMLEDTTNQNMLEKTKKEFFANASHELKSPLTSIIGYQQLISEGIETDPQVMIEYSKKTIKEAKRMNNIVIDMLNLSKLENNEPIINEQIEVSDLIYDIIDSLDRKIKEKNITINYQIEKTYINCDRNHCYQLIRNLIDNAIKYNIKDGQINICCNNKVLSIEDNGIGIDEINLPRIFERFYRVDKAKSKTLGGTGLGLAIVKHVCEIHNFNISVESQINKGSKFIIYWNQNNGL